MSSRPTLFLIDGNSQMYRAYHAHPRPDRSRRPIDQRGLRLRHDAPQAAQRPPARVHRRVVRSAGADVPRRLAADYKANRAPMPADLAEQIPLVHARVRGARRADPRRRGLRGRRRDRDDRARRAGDGYEVAIVTGDKDFFQLVGDGIRVFNPRDEGTWYDAAGVKEKFGVAPDQVVDVLALMGDAIDNIKGVPGIGEKGARELIGEHGSLDALLARAAEVPQKKVPRGARSRTPTRRAQSRELARIRHRRAGRVRPRVVPLPRAVARALLRALQPARLPDRSSRSSRRPRTRSTKDYALVDDERGARRAGRRDRRGRPLRAARPRRLARPPMRAGIVGLALRDPRARRAVRAARPQRDARRPAAAASTRRSAALTAAARGRGDREDRPRPEVRRDRARAPRRRAGRPRRRHDARQLPARRDAVGAPARGHGARAPRATRR